MSSRKGVAQHTWTDDERARLAEIAPGRSHAEIREIMTAEFGDHFGGTRITGALKRYGIKTGRTGRFEKGQTSWNKGKTWDEFMPKESQERCRAMQFKKGQLNGIAKERLKDVGYERVDAKDGYIYVKVKDTPQAQVPGSFNDTFRPKHHVVYEQAYGSIPRGCNVVFADHDKRNFDPDNLVAVPRSLWSVITKRRMDYYDRASLELCMNIARVERARYAAQCRPRPCKRCGDKFKPRYAHQRTCDGCLGRNR